MSSERICRKCGAALREDALEGLCGRCLARLAFEMTSGDGRNGNASSSRQKEFGEYELLGEIARGGMGVVYKARHKNLNRLVALKMILHGPFSNQEFVQRFQIEAEAAARLHHPNIVTIYEVGEHDGHRFLAMEYVEGQDFGALAQEKPLPSRRAAAHIKSVAEAIHYAHGEGIIHRDLKPSNLLLDVKEQPRVTDFGLAKVMSSDTALTLTGQALGSPGYMAPERAAGKSSDGGAEGDIYSLGAVLYYLLTGRPPFQGETPQDILLQMHNSEPVAPRRLNPAVPVDLETICMKCLQPEPAKRYDSAGELAEDLGRFLAREPITARPVSKFEKFRLWCRRRPIQTALSAALALALVCGVAGIFVEWRRAEQHASGESRERQKTQDYAGKMALELYAADINLSAQAIERGDLGLARRTLEALQPKPGQEDLRGFEWRYLANLARGSQLATLAGHTWIVTCAAFSPDGKILATGGQDGAVKIWDVSGKKLVATLPSKGAVWSVGFTPEGALLMVAGNVRGVEFWNLAKMERVTTFPGQIAALSHSGTLVAIADSSPFYWEKSGTVTMRDYKSGTKPREFNRSGRALALSPDDKLLAVAQPQRNVEIWDAMTGEVRQVVRTDSPVWSVAFSPDGKRLLTTGWSADALVWSLGTNAPPQALKGHSHNTWSGTFSPDGLSIVTTGSDQTVRFWDSATLQPGLVLRGHGNEVWCAAFAPDGKWLATGGKDQMVMLWAAGRTNGSAEVRDSQFITPTFSPDGKRVGVITQSGDLWQPEVVEMESGKSVAKLPPREAIGFLPDGKRSVVLNRSLGALEFWTPGNATPETITLQDAEAGEDGMASFGFSPTCEKFFAVDGSGIIHWWETATGKLLGTLNGPKPPIRHAVLGPGGQRLAISLEHENFVRLYDLPSKRGVELPGHRDFVSGLAFSPDGALLASGSMDGTIKLWDCASARELATLPGHVEETTGVAFSPDGRTLASVGRKDSVKLWHVATLRELVSIDLPDAANYIAFTPDGSRLAVTTLKDTLHFFDAPQR